MNTFSLSLLIPAKNEERRLPPFLEKVVAFSRSFHGKVQVIVIDDGSHDATADVVLQAASDYPDLKLIQLPVNKGKGYAIKRAMFQAEGKYIIFLDADGSTPVSEIDRHMPLMESGVDIVIGSRVLKDASSKVEARIHRKWIGTVFNAFVHTFLIKDIKDTQCGFKMFRKEVVPDLFGRLYLDGYGFDLELLYVAKQRGLKIKEVPVNWHHVNGSKVNLFSDSFSMLKNIFQVRSWHPLPLPSKPLHMSVEEIENMYHREKSHWWFKAKRHFMKNAFLQLPLPDRMLDAGCGTGENAKALHKETYYVGTDAVFEALQCCQKNGLKALVQSNLTEMGFKSGSFDLIVCMDVLEHIDDDRAALLELKRLLSENGKILLAVPAWRRLFSPHDIALSHKRRYNPADFKSLIDDCGLSCETIRFWYTSIFVPVYVIRWFKKHFSLSCEPVSDTYKTPPPWLNGFLSQLLRMEAQLQKYFALPFGTTLVAVISKNGSLDQPKPLV